MAVNGQPDKRVHVALQPQKVSWAQGVGITDTSHDRLENAVWRQGAPTAEGVAFHDPVCVREYKGHLKGIAFRWSDAAAITLS